VFIGLQIRPILVPLDPAMRIRYLWIAAVVLITVIVVRIGWLAIYYAVVKTRSRHAPRRPREFRPPATFRGALVVGWSGMRGIVTLAAALALPAEVGGTAFPFRDLIVLTAFAVVLGTLVIQGLTLGPLVRAFQLRDDDPVAREVRTARDRALGAAIAILDSLDSEMARVVRQEFESHLQPALEDVENESASHQQLHRSALVAARRTILDMRANDEIGDDAFHLLEEEFDWIEMATDAQE
jgi:CPA1 family monovalent cation:H+ antiporter